MIINISDFPLGNGFGINTNLLETNVLNLAVVIGVLVVFGGDVLTSILKNRQELIVKSLNDAEERFKPPIFIIVSDPAGDPVLRYDSTNFLKINFDLSLICAYTLSDIRILFKNNIYLLLLNLYEKR